MRKNMTKTVLVAVGLLAMTGAAVATSATDNEFGGLYNMMTSWTQGYLAKALALIAFLFGSGIGIAKQSIIPAIFGIVVALVLTIGPGVVTNMFTATI
jgi:conjugal transfer pilus assembly protein TraA